METDSTPPSSADRKGTIAFSMITGISILVPIIPAVSNGQDIYFRVAFKSVATILMEQETVNMEGEDTILKARGRHDPCVLPRAVPIVESMTAMTLLDYLLIQKTRENF